MIESLALLAFRHRWKTLIGWVAGVALLLTLSSAFAGAFENGGRLTGTDSDAAYQLLGTAFPDSEGDSVTVAFHVPPGVGLDSANAAQAIRTYTTEAAKVPNVGAVSGPGQVSPDGTTGIGQLVFTGTEAEQTKAVESLRVLADKAAADGVEVTYASWGFSEGGMNGAAEIVGIIAAIVILMISFGSVVAMGVPIISALMGVAAAIASVGLWAAVATTPDYTREVAVMIGLGVGIDYAVFIITRYRHALAHGSTPERAIREAMGTAGRAVVFAGAIVVVSLLGMTLVGIASFTGLAIGSATSVLIAVFSALTLVPALLSIMGRRVSQRALRVAHSQRETFWHRWARFVQRHATLAAATGAGVLLVLGAPIAVMRLASTDLGSTSTGTTTRKAYDRLAAGFGPGVNGPLVIAIPSAAPGTDREIESISAHLADMDGVALVQPPTVSEDGTVSMLTVFPKTSPQDEATADLVDRIRAYLRSTPLDAHVGGATASDIDFAGLISDRLPVFIGVVLAASFLLLMAVFRSVLVPLKAVVLNLMSIGAAYGLMVIVFQWGWFGSVFGLEAGAPIEPWAPLILFAIVFGLSMDYEVFLLSSVHERFAKTGDNSHAVVEGLSSTARVITAAASIMVMVFGAFIFNDDRSLKLIGFGLASAVLVDATIVRMLLVPATMELLGERNWWMPAWLDRLLPRLAIEGNIAGKVEGHVKGHVEGTASLFDQVDQVDQVDQARSNAASIASVRSGSSSSYR